MLNRVSLRFFRGSYTKLIMVDNNKTPIITLTQKEKEIFGTLIDVLTTNGLKTSIRGNGGWVRDKVMGLESDDIDISLDNMSGEDFA